MNIGRRHLSPLVLIGYIPFFGRIMRVIIKHYYLLMELDYLVVSRMGALFLVDHVNKVDRDLLVKGEWEGLQISHLQKLVDQYRLKHTESIFLDIGAHGGLYSILMQQCGLFSEIIAFEPDRQNLAQLHANIFINNLVGSICVTAAAATSQPGKVSFFSGRDRNRGLSHIITDVESTDEYIVDGVRIDDVVKHRGRFVAAKIDVEGFEGEVLGGMENVIRSNSCVLQIEIFSENLVRTMEITKSYGLELVGQIGGDYYFVKS